MHVATALVFLGALLHGVADGADEGDEEDVLRLTKDTWEQTLQKHDRVLVVFYTPGESCSNCKELLKDCTKATRMLQAEQLQTIVTKVDTSVDAELGSQFGVKSWPTLKYFVNGKFNKDYDGKQNYDGITLWLRNKEDPPVKEIKEEELEAFLDDVEEDEFALVAHVKKKSTRAKAFFKSVEDTLREWDVAKIKFGAIWLPKDADPKADAKLFMHRPGIMAPDPEHIDYTGSVWSEEKITWWAQNCSYPTLGKKFTRNQYAPMSMDAMGWTAAIVGLTDDHTEREDEEQRDEPLLPKLQEAMLPFAIENPQWKFVMAEIEKLEDHEHELLSVKYGDEPRIIVVQGGRQGRRYHLIGEEAILDHEKINEFLNDFKAKKLKPYFKSAPAPEKDYDEDGSLILIGNTFEEVVLDEEKDVFVEFYAPWCEHCKKLAPEWAKLAKKAEKLNWNDRGVIIAKMDTSQNECDEEIPSFPRMVLYPAVKAHRKFKERQIYSGDREAGALYDFVAAAARNLQDDEQEDETPKKKRRRKRKQGDEKTNKAAEEL